MIYENYICWVDPITRVLSFHPVMDAECREFNSHDDLIDFAMKISEAGYQIQ